MAGCFRAARMAWEGVEIGQYQLETCSSICSSVFPISDEHLDNIRLFPPNCSSKSPVSDDHLDEHRNNPVEVLQNRI